MNHFLIWDLSRVTILRVEAPWHLAGVYKPRSPSGTDLIRASALAPARDLHYGQHEATAEN